MEWLWLLLCAAALIFAAAGLWWWWHMRPLPDSGNGPGAPFEPLELVNLSINGWTIRYHQEGRGPHLLLVHGIGAELTSWRLLLPFMNRFFTVTALDLPGFGQSSKPADADYGLDAQVERLVAFLDALEIQETFVVGSSMGGNLALWLALKHPDRVAGVAVIAPATSPKLIPLALEHWVWLSHPLSLLLTRPAMRWAHRRVVSKVELVDSLRVDTSFRTYSRRAPAVKSFMLATAAIRDPRLLESLSGLKDKVLLLWGSKDKLVSRNVIGALESTLPKVESHVHIGGGHHLHEDEPEWVADKIRTFFLD